MRQTTLGLSFAAALLLAGNAFAVDPQLMNLVMPDAKVLAGANITSTVTSPTAQFLIMKLGGVQIPTGPLASLGFNPLQDVTEILAATTADPSSPAGLVLARGTFPVEQNHGACHIGGEHQMAGEHIRRGDAAHSYQ